MNYLRRGVMVTRQPIAIARSTSILLVSLQTAAASKEHLIKRQIIFRLAGSAFPQL